MKKVLFLTYDFPYPFNSGGKIRAYNLLKYARLGYDISLYSFTRGEVSGRAMNKIKELGIERIYLCPRPVHNLQSKIKSIISTRHSIFHRLYYLLAVEEQLVEIIRKEKIDILHCESFYTAFYISDRITNTGVKTVFGTENVEHKIYENYVTSSVHPMLKKIYAREVVKIKNEELQAAQRADLVLAVTQEEADYFKDYGAKRTVVIENGIDLDYFAYNLRKKSAAHTLLFVGNFKYFPNREAVKFIYHEVFKKLTNTDFNLTVIGKNAEKLPIPLARNIRLIDYIDDIRDAYKEADAFIFPVTIGGGTNFKVLEAMATGVPIVAIPDRLNALGAKENIHFIPAANGKEFVKCIETLLGDPKKNEKITRNAHEFVVKHYGWDTIGKKLQKAWRNL